MATNSLPSQRTAPEVSTAEPANQVLRWALSVLHLMASLKLSVALFALAIVLILVGTLAQDEMNMWEVIHTYFYSVVTYVELQVFFPRTWFPNMQNVPLGFWYPGGALIGTLMLVNLLSAHLLRFRVQAQGGRLWGGLAVIALGVAITVVVILSGHTSEGLQGQPPFSWDTLWYLIEGALALTTIGLAAGAVTRDRSQIAHRLACIVLACVAGGLLLAMIIKGERLSDSAMRILWYLLYALGAAVILLIGSLMVFRKRGGVVLLHAGIVLLMVGQLVVSQVDVEERMMIGEGETVSHARDIRSVELAIVDPTPADHEKVIAVPLTEEGIATPYHKQGQIELEKLPFRIEIVEYLKNSQLVQAGPKVPNRATAGHGLQMIAQEQRGSSGADSSGAVDVAAAYVKLVDKTSGKSLGTYMLSQDLSSQNIVERVTVNGVPYELSLRFKRTYKPYMVKLLDVRKVDYPGTSTPKDYSSFVQLIDPTRNVDRPVRIWMNNPLRYAGETFYQSNYFMDRAGREFTDLQVVKNTGWLIPYLACVIVVVGMLAHFWGTLQRFIMRVTGANRAAVTDDPLRPEHRPYRSPKPAPAPKVAEPASRAELVLPIAVVAALVLVTGLWMRGPSAPSGQADLYKFGQLPVMYEGRIKPLDTLARNSLRVISERETFTDAEGNRQPAIRWLADVITSSEDAERHPVFRIDHPEVRDVLGLERRKGYRYSVEELRKNIHKFEEQVVLAQKTEEDSRSLFQRRVLELDRKIRTYTLLAASFQPPSLPALPTAEEFSQDHQAAAAKIQAFKQAWQQNTTMLERMQPPRAVPLEPQGSDETAASTWQPYASAWVTAYVKTRILGEEPDEATLALNTILVSYEQGDVAAFNREVAKYHDYLQRTNLDLLNVSKVRFESFYNRVSPFVFCGFLYVVAFLITALSWLGWYKPMNRAAFWAIVFIFLLHTLALAGRIYISGRPPVTNLYSSAVFIGWACVLFGLIIEAIYRLSIGNVVATWSGFMTLLIAHFLAGDGDTFTVLQAVLDTQFWLTTHVVTVTLGYATTFVAGFLGIVYIFGGLLSPSLRGETGRSVARMIYGILCFAILFSFFGTVLGGLWADDSWGRFWGWDPKENGALIIVLWNALILHARWGGMVKDRGMAVLAVVGNIVTSWSWFGVNELGLGLHSYGFTEGRLFMLFAFVLSQLAIIAIGLIPQRFWISFRQNAPQT